MIYSKIDLFVLQMSMERQWNIVFDDSAFKNAKWSPVSALAGQSAALIAL